MSKQPQESPFVETTIEEANSIFSEYIQFFRDFVIILIVVIFIRTFIITPFQINGQSMQESYHNNEFILVDKFSYLDFAHDMIEYQNHENLWWFAKIWQKIPIHIGDPRRGDVVVIKPHVDREREYYIKRVIALPGDTIKIEWGHVFIKLASKTEFIQLLEPYLSSSNNGQTFLPMWLPGNGEFIVPDDAYWVMWDNRNNSADSRSCFRDCTGITDVSAHFIKRSDVLGRVLIDFWYFHIFRDNWIPDWKNIWWNPAPRFFSSPSTATYPELGE